MQISILWILKDFQLFTLLLSIVTIILKSITIINSKFETEISSFRQREGDENVDKARGRRKWGGHKRTQTITFGCSK